MNLSCLKNDLINLIILANYDFTFNLFYFQWTGLEDSSQTRMVTTQAT